METKKNSYQLKQGNKEYIFKTSLIDGETIKMVCTNKGGQSYSRKFKLDELKSIDQIFDIIKSPSEALDFIDKALTKHKVGVKEEIGKLKIVFYLTTKGIVHQIYIPLGKIITDNISSDNIQISTKEYTNTEVMQNNNYQNYQNINNLTEEYPTSNYNSDNNAILGNSGGEYQQSSSYDISGNAVDMTNTNAYVLEQTNTNDINEILGGQTTTTNTNYLESGETSNIGSLQQETTLGSNEFISHNYNNLEYPTENANSLSDLTTNAEYTTTNIINEISSDNIISNENISNENIENNFTGDNQYFQTNLDVNVPTTENEMKPFSTNIPSDQQIENTNFEKYEAQYNQNSVPLPSFDTNQYLNNIESSNQYTASYDTTTIETPLENLPVIDDTTINAAQTTTEDYSLNQLSTEGIASNQFVNIDTKMENQITTQEVTSTNLYNIEGTSTNIHNVEADSNNLYNYENASTNQFVTDDNSTNQFNTDNTLSNQFLTTDNTTLNQFTTTEGVSENLYSTQEVPSTQLASEGVSENLYSAQEVPSAQLTTEGVSENLYSTQEVPSTQLTTEGISLNQFTTEGTTENLFNKEFSSNLYTTEDSLANKFTVEQRSADLLENDISSNQIVKEEATTNLFSTDYPTSNTFDMNQYMENINIPSEPTVPAVKSNFTDNYNQTFETTTTTTTTTHNFVDGSSTFEPTFQQPLNEANDLLKSPKIDVTDKTIELNLYKKSSIFSSPVTFALPKIKKEIEPEPQPQPSLDLNIGLAQPLEEPNYDINAYPTTQYDQYQTNIETTTNTTEYLSQPQPQPVLQSPMPNYNDDRINKLVGDTNSLKTQHQQIQEKLSALSGEINSYKNQIGILEKERENNEVNALRAENMAIKKQLSELNQLRNKAAEVNILRTQLAELDPLKKKAAEMEILKRQLMELNDLKSKVEELNGVKAQVRELNQLKAQISQMNNMQAQLGELNKLRMQVADAERLRAKLQQMEADKIQYEQQIENLRNSQKIELLKMKNLVNSNVNSQNISFGEKTKNIIVKGDIIRNMGELEMLTRKINKLNKKITLNLLYKASADSDKASAFHERCDDAESSLVLIETDKGKRFGGFTTCSWRGDCIDKKDEEAFVFSLDKMLTYDNIPGEDAIGCYPKFGPIFLGCQIRIYDNAFTKGGTTFEKGLNFNTEEDFELTGGDRLFNVKEIEVYEVIAQ